MTPKPVIPEAAKRLSGTHNPSVTLKAGRMDSGLALQRAPEGKNKERKNR
jgi:hypothetical protein